MGGWMTRFGVTARAALLFAVNTVVQMLFVAAEWVDSYGWTYDGAVDDLGPTAFVLVLLYPVFFTWLLIALMFVFRRTRALAKTFIFGREALILYAALVASAVLIYAVDQFVLGAVIGWIGITYAAFTQLGIEDRGPQPWIGLAFLLWGYGFGFGFGIDVVAEQNEPTYALPTSVAGWTVGVVGLVITLWGAVKHWRNTSHADYADLGYPSTELDASI